QARAGWPSARLRESPGGEASLLRGFRSSGPALLFAPSIRYHGPTPFPRVSLPYRPIGPELKRRNEPYVDDERRAARAAADGGKCRSGCGSASRGGGGGRSGPPVRPVQEARGP